MKTKNIILTLTLILISRVSLANEPTEKEMVSAIQNKINGYHAGTEAMKQGCNRIRESQNPFDSINCMMGGMMGMAKLSITSFEKIGCAKARATGYYCDYRVGISTGGLLGSMDGMGGGINTKRFINTRTGWVITD